MTVEITPGDEAAKRREELAAKNDPLLYAATVGSMEPNIHAVDPGAFYASAGISLKRSADAMERIADALEDRPPRRFSPPPFDVFSPPSRIGGGPSPFAVIGLVILLAVFVLAWWRPWE